MAGHVPVWTRLPTVVRRAAGRSVTYRYWRPAGTGAVTTNTTINMGDGLSFLPASSSISTAIASQRLQFLSTSTTFKMPSYIVSSSPTAVLGLVRNMH